MTAIKMVVPPAPTSAAKWMTGVVKWFDFRRGYGFVTLNNGRDVFVHMGTALQAGVVQMRPGLTAHVLTDAKPDGKLVACDIEMVR